jgi:hypothetical protein
VVKVLRLGQLNALCSRKINPFSGSAETQESACQKVGAVCIYHVKKCQLTKLAALVTREQVLCKVEVVILINELSQQRKCERIFYS